MAIKKTKQKIIIQIILLNNIYIVHGFSYIQVFVCFVFVFVCFVTSVLY